MKKILLIGILIISFSKPNNLHAQRSIEISPFIGYTFSGSANGYTALGYVNYDIKDDMSYGVVINTDVGDLTQGELSYTRIDTRMIRTGSLLQPEYINMGIEYYQLGGVKKFMLQEDLFPFVKLSLGANRYFDKGGVYDSSWAFSAIFGAGIKKFFSERIGIKLYTNLNMPMKFNGLGIWVGTGGAGGGANFYVPLVHWDLGGALIFKLE